MRPKTKTILAVLIATILSVPMLFAFACQDKTGAKFDNENSPLVLPITIGETTAVFNPFTATGGNDREILDRMLTPLISHDHVGNPVAGKDIDSVALDFAEAVDENGNQKVTYVLKNNLKYANGDALTLKDVLFSHYVYLDTNYIGGETLYALNIKGVKEFRGVEGVQTRDYVEGIKRVKGDVTIKGTTYPEAKYDSDGNFTGEGYEAFSIEIEGIDAKLVAHAMVYIVSMQQYSTQEAINAFDFETQQYGTKPRDKAFFENINGDIAPRVPIASSAYQAANSRYEPTLDYSAFTANGITNLVRNDYFGSDSGSNVIKPAKIKKVAYQDIAASNIYDLVRTGAVHYGTIDPQPDVINALNAQNKLTMRSVQNNGYGYMGINAGLIPELEARQAIMFAMDTQMSVNYYPATYAQKLNRSISVESWAYPQDAEDRYLYIADNSDGSISQEQYQQVGQLLAKAGYKVSGQGFNENPSGKILSQKFVVPGSALAGHPAYPMLEKGSKILNDLGQDTEVVAVADGMQQIQAGTGKLAVWVAAWSAGTDLDPDMTQNYHKNSQATNIRNNGFGDGILQYGTDNSGNFGINANGTRPNEDQNYYREWEMVNELADIIVKARGLLAEDRDDRKDMYSDALDILLEIAVEMPTYQRKNIRFWDSTILDADTFTPSNQFTSMNDLLRNLWNISFK